MPHTWSNNADWLLEVANGPDESNRNYRRAVSGIASLAVHIRDSDLASFLYGHTSMHALVIRQTNEPYPWKVYLLISPLHSGDVEFRYHDTEILTRQWARTVASDQVIPRFHKFMDQLR